MHRMHCHGIYVFDFELNRIESIRKTKIAQNEVKIAKQNKRSENQ